MKNYVVIGLGFGDEGKGTIVDFLEPDQVVRFSGGPQAAHYVVTPEGMTHCFAQLGSGSFHGAETYLSRFMAVDPFLFIEEFKTFIGLPFKYPEPKVSVDINCSIITPYHMIYSQAYALLKGRSTVGLGVGTALTNKEKLLAKNLKSKQITKSRIRILKAYYMDQVGQMINICSPIGIKTEITNLYNMLISFDLDYIVDIYCGDFLNLIKLESKIRELKSDEIRVFEGSQGVLLDKNYGFKPHITQSNTTAYNVNTLMEESKLEGDLKIVGVIRPYMTRHGKGPLPTENIFLTKCLIHHEKHNCDNKWQGPFRFGHLDLPLLKYSLYINKLMNKEVDYLAITNMDRISQDYDSVKVCTLYDNIIGTIPQIIDFASPIYQNIGINSFFEFVEEILQVPIKIVSEGPTREDKYWRFKK